MIKENLPLKYEIKILQILFLTQLVAKHFLLSVYIDKKEWKSDYFEFKRFPTFPSRNPEKEK